MGMFICPVPAHHVTMWISGHRRLRPLPVLLLGLLVGFGSPFFPTLGFALPQSPFLAVIAIPPLLVVMRVSSFPSRSSLHDGYDMIHRGQRRLLVALCLCLVGTLLGSSTLPPVPS